MASAKRQFLGLGQNDPSIRTSQQKGKICPFGRTSQQQLSYFRGLRYEAEKQEITNPAGVVGKNYPQLRTSQQLADEFGVSEKTILGVG